VGKDPNTSNASEIENNRVQIEDITSTTQTVVSSPKMNSQHHRLDTAMSDDDSSSVPSSNDESLSSSSVPSSSDESIESIQNDGNNNSDKIVNDNSNLPHIESKVKEKSKERVGTYIPKVIAPEQKFDSKTLRSQTNRYHLDDEGIDDFDDIEDVKASIESNKDQLTASSSTNPTNLSLLSSELTNARDASCMTLQQASDMWNLAPFLVKNLELNGVKNYFPIQAMVVPDVIASERHAHIRSRDACVNAPTGSGKTLAFVLPILNALAKRRVVRLRALVILPGRDLAMQVYNVFEKYCHGSSLKVGLAIGQNDFEAEQRALILGKTMDSNGFSPEEGQENKINGNKYVPLYTQDKNYYLLKHWFDSNNPDSAFEAFDGNPDGHISSASSPQSKKCFDSDELGINCIKGITSQAGGRSAVDILVCTPGRLIDHLDRTPCFTLQHLRYLIVDEADRLVSQGYQDWIRKVNEAAFYGPQRLCSVLRSWRNENLLLKNNHTLRIDEDNCTSTNEQDTFDDVLGPRCDESGRMILDPVTWRRDETFYNDTDQAQEYQNDISLSLASSLSRPVQLRKFLFSATLTSDPRKLSSLGLVNPKRFDAQDFDSLQRSNGNIFHGATDGTEKKKSDGPKHISQYFLPDGLEEYTVECSAQQKPLFLLALLREQIITLGDNATNNHGIVIVFTSSVDSTHRLARLLQILWAASGYGPPNDIAEFSSSMNQSQRAKLIRDCQVKSFEKMDRKSRENSPQLKDLAPRIKIVICSDGLSRGMDVSSVMSVINYDLPSLAKTYVHRCGRTARAGRNGRAISILKAGQHGRFEEMRKLINHSNRVKRNITVKKHLVSEAVPIYKACVSKLRHIIAAEDKKSISTTTPLDMKWIPNTQTNKLFSK